MKSRPRASLAFLLGACALLLAADAPEDRSPAAARRAVQQRLRHRQPSVRAEAFRNLNAFPPMDAAKLAVQSGLADRQSEVRQAAYESLRRVAADAEVASWLLKSVEELTRGQPDPDAAAPLIAALLVSRSEEVQDRLRIVLDEWPDGQAAAVATMVTVADHLASQPDERSLASIERLTRLKRFSDSFAFRRAVVQAMMRLHRREAVERLVELLPATDGEVRADIVRYLAKVTGQVHLEKPEAWIAWWKEHRDAFEMPEAPLAPRPAAKIGQPAARSLPQMLPGGPSYYGLAIHARRVVFVIDISGSMQGARIAAAKRELAGAVQALPEDREFNILAYNQAVGVWQPSLVRATDANKQNATRFVAYLNATGHTATYDAIDAAFRFDVEAVYFLTDGEPTTGKFVAPRDILEAVSQGNRRRRISIYAVGVGPGAAGSPLDTFLKMLAEQNFGLYRRVDQ